MVANIIAEAASEITQSMTDGHDRKHYQERLSVLISEGVIGVRSGC